MALNYPVSGQISINSPVIQLCLFIKLILLSNSSLSGAFMLTQLLTEQVKHSFAGTHPTLMAGTVRHRHHIHKLLCNTDTLQPFPSILFQISQLVQLNNPSYLKSYCPGNSIFFLKNTINVAHTKQYWQSFLQLLMWVLNISTFFSVSFSCSCLWTPFHNYC